MKLLHCAEHKCSDIQYISEGDLICQYIRVWAQTYMHVCVVQMVHHVTIAWPWTSDYQEYNRTCTA